MLRILRAIKDGTPVENHDRLRPEWTWYLERERGGLYVVMAEPSLRNEQRAPIVFHGCIV